MEGDLQSELRGWKQDARCIVIKTSLSVKSGKLKKYLLHL